MTTTGPDEAVAEGFATVIATLQAAARSPGPTNSATRVPVTLLTGFLGAGKTTVLRTLLAGDHGLNVTAIVNDIGGVNVDAIAVRTSRQRFELTNGCACCVLTDDLADSLSEAAATGPPDAIVVEASGAADAVALAATIEAVPDVRLDGIVAVVDGSAWFNRGPAFAELFDRQLASAHLVLVSKLDLVDGHARAAALGAIADTAPGRRVLPITNGDIDPALLLDAAVLGATIRPPRGGRHPSFPTRTLRPEAPLSVSAVASWLDRPHGLVRAKGWFRSTGDDCIELQVVGRRWSLTPTPRPVEPVIVLIGQTDAELDDAARAFVGVRRSSPD